MTSRSLLLRHAIPLIPSYGFSRQTLALAALHLPRPHAEPLSEGAITALFGTGDGACKNLAWAWLEEGRRRMKGLEDAPENTQRMAIPIEVSLRRRLKWNETVLDKLPEVFRLLASPVTHAPPFNLLPGAQHVSLVADEACSLAQDGSFGLSWYSRRAAIAGAYAAAELHQITASPETAPELLGRLLETTASLSKNTDEALRFGEFVARSCVSIARSKGVPI